MESPGEFLHKTMYVQLLIFVLREICVYVMYAAEGGTLKQWFIIARISTIY